MCVSFFFLFLIVTLLNANVNTMIKLSCLGPFFTLSFQSLFGLFFFLLNNSLKVKSEGVKKRQKNKKKKGKCWI